MAEYIEREAVIARINRRMETHSAIGDYSVGKYGGLRVAIQLIELIPAADVAEVKRGRWVRKVESKLDTHTGEYWEEEYCSCPLCGKDSDCEHNFCPNCGADMREGFDAT